MRTLEASPQRPPRRPHVHVVRPDIRTSAWEETPVTDKESFVKRYRLEDRCWAGSLPARGVTVDESSGSTGTIQRAGRTDIIEQLRARGVRMLNLPLLFHYGRSDLSVSYFGATVSPEGIRQALHAVPALDGAVESFQAFNAQNENDDATLVVAVELASGRDKATFDILDVRSQFAAELGRVDRDFATVYSTAPVALRPEIRLYDRQTGPFQDGHKQIKHTYVAGVIQYDDIPV